MAISLTPASIGIAPGSATAPPGCAATEGTDHLAQHFDRALQHLESGRWANAFDQFAKLADLGHTPSARIARMLALRGPSLFGGAFHATSAQLAQWLRISG